MTEPVVCKFKGEIEVPEGFTAEVTIRFIPTPPEPEPLPANSPPAESEAA